MESIVRSLRNCLPEDLESVKPASGRVLIEQHAPLRFWSAFIGALEAGSSVALLDPSWPREWKEDLTRQALSFPPDADPCILIATSGTTGLPKFCNHSLDTLIAAARGFGKTPLACAHPHAVNVLPPFHIGGLMPVFRAAICGSRVHFADYRDPQSLSSAPFLLREASISLVPTQLQRMRHSPDRVDVLKHFGLILVGGAACPPELLSWARSAGLRLAPCYGSTETAAMVTLLPPEAFLSGSSGVGYSLPHARIEILEEGRVATTATSLFRGYPPDFPLVSRTPFRTGDIGHLEEDGNLILMGRADRIIISGGKKVHPEIVEQAALESGLLSHAECRGLPDPEWGQRIELRITPVEGESPVIDRLFAYLKDTLPPYARPKEIHLISDC